jgi:hypothetical protein
MVVEPLSEPDDQFKDCVPLPPPSVSVANEAPASLVTVNVPLLVMYASSLETGTAAPLQLVASAQPPLTGFNHTRTAACTGSVASRSQATWKAITADRRVKSAEPNRRMLAELFILDLSWESPWVKFLPAALIADTIDKALDFDAARVGKIPW